METNSRRTRGAQTGPRSKQVVGSVRAATLSELERAGFAAMTIDAVARAAGVNRSTIYRRWPSKEALLAAVVEPLLERYDDPPASGDPVADLALVMAMVRDAWESPEGQAFSAAAGSAHEELKSLQDQVVQRSLAPLQRVLGRAAQQGLLAADDVALAAHLAFYGVATWQRASDTTLSDEDCRRMAALLVRGPRP